jgi:hypothetical protein
MLRIVPVIVLTLLFSPLAAWAKEPESAQTIQQLADDIVNKPPPTYFSLATELYREGQRDEAAFWYYVGLIRYRVWILAKGKEAESSEDAYHFSVLVQSLGQSFYAHVDRDSAALIRAIDKALAWDLAQPNAFTSKDAFKAQYERARQELLALQQKLKLAPASLKPEPLAGRGMFSW